MTTALDTMCEVEVGDFVASTILSQFTGFVIGTGTLGKKWPAWKVELWNGKEEVFPKESTRLVCKSDAWEERYQAEIAAGRIVLLFACPLPPQEQSS